MTGKKKDVYDYRSKLPFVKYKNQNIVWWNVTPTGKWVADFNIGRQYALKFWEVCGSGRTFALEFQQVILGMLTTAKTHNKDAGYSGVEAGFLLAVGELSGGVIHVDALLQNYEARAPRYRVVVRPLDRSGIGIGQSLPDDWEFGVILQHMT
jgi:hypothetical protein